MGVPGPPVKRNRVAMDEEGADEPEVNVQAFSTAKDEYVSHCSLFLGTLQCILICCLGQTAAEEIWGSRWWRRGSSW